MRLLDLFCGAGGAAMGYYRAGFTEIVGVDIEPQPNYPFEFFQHEAVSLLNLMLAGAAGFEEWPFRSLRDFEAIHASPPCQAFTIAQNARKQAHLHPNLIEPIRPLILATGLPYVIENVPGAPLVRPFILCGTMFGLQADGFELRRHRLFESNIVFPLVAPCQHRLPAAPLFGHNPNADFYKRHGQGFTLEQKKRVMGIDWMNRDEIREAIPPAYTQFIGEQLIEQLQGAS